jgi:aspartyl-tRNA(Asn)/glutamyl-tRNA(Gln) amidotransferase subunit B
MADKNNLETVIGLEIHAQLNTKSKMFCSCFNDPEEEVANKNVCPTCLAHPGTLPIINEGAVNRVVRCGLALNCEILEESEFARKSYFYPDLPKGYQISQADKPLCQNGFLEISDRKIRIQRIHLEEDTARLAHSEDGLYSMVDFNRAGLPLMELVTQPDFISGEQVVEFAQELQLILRYLGASNADMEKGEMRVEANVSVQPPGAPHASGTKVELKNLNSFKAVRDAINYELKRQGQIIEEGGKVDQETRGWDGHKTILQRKKEVAQEYRYFPEPDLLPIRWSSKEIESFKQSLPELPGEKRGRFSREYDLDQESVSILIRERDLGIYFEKAASELLRWMRDEKIEDDQLSKLMKLLANYLISDVKGIIVGSIDDSFKMTPENFAELIILVFQKKLSSRLAKDLLPEMIKTGADPSHIMSEKGIAKIDDEKALKPLIQRIISENTKAKDDYAQGKKEAVQFLVGQLMSATRGAVDPDMARSMIEEELNS